MLLSSHDILSCGSLDGGSATDPRERPVNKNQPQFCLSFAKTQMQMLPRRSARSDLRLRPHARQLWSRVSDWLSGRTLVGQDDDGRKYYSENGGTTRAERRLFVGDPDSQLPAEWLAWLRHTRASPPTPEESRQLAAARAERSRRVDDLRERERQRRTRSQVMGEQTGEAAGAEQLASGDDFQPRQWRP